MSDGASSTTPEESNYEVSPALRKRLQQLYEHASQMMSKPKYDYDYAHSLLGECCRRDPANLVYVEKMFENLDLKFKGKKKGSVFSAFGGKGGVKKALAAKKWLEVISEGIDLLKNNPYDSVTLRAMVDACAALRFNEVGLRYMKNAMDGSPGDMEVMRHCARYLGKVGQFDQAISLWHFIEEKKRGDDEANKMISQLTIDRERRAQGLATVTNRIDPEEAAKLRRKQLAAQEEAGGAAPPVAKGPLTEKQKLKARIENNPDVSSNYIMLIDLCCEEGKFFEADEVLKQALTHFGDTLELIEKREELLIVKARHRFRLAEKQAAATPNPAPELLELVETSRNDLNRIELEVYSKRNQRKPGDVALKYELAVRLKRVGNFEQAEQLFEEVAQADDKLFPICYLGKGECLQSRKQYAAALAAYEEGLTRSENMSSDGLKLLLYRAGVLAQGLKEWVSASRNLKRLHKLDASYKDVKLRLDKLL
ncbi:hypothetical protein DTL42_21375 [Bremerella cremea]|uniref:Tetratricopeptide repeat protein n=1 Tax=Bremerella cremea TaxID=1031537 RepID=A0A368KNN5_9BACT|nr:hypothetical protein [Bremerella cremea]RCS41130.1 hypothetical protein DTL42_21375 [Bremerella cremea]